MLTGFPSSNLEALGFDLGTVRANANRVSFFIFGSSRVRSGYCDWESNRVFVGLAISLTQAMI